MTFDPLLLRSHVWLYPRIIVSKSHENMPKYVDTVTLWSNKAVPEPRVSPAFTITYFCNHCNIRFDPIPAKTWTKGHWPLDDRWPQVCWGHMCDSTQGSLYPSPIKIHRSMWIQWPFFKNLNQRSLTPRWPLTPHLLRSHVWLYPRII